MANFKMLKVSPRGFANEVFFLRVPLADIAEADAEFADYADKTNGGYAKWTRELRANNPGVAVNWADRSRLLG